MTLEKGFPRQLLDSSRDERYEYFKDKTIRHDKLTRVHEQVKKAVHYAPRGSLILNWTWTVPSLAIVGELSTITTSATRPAIEFSMAMMPPSLCFLSAAILITSLKLAQQITAVSFP